MIAMALAICVSLATPDFGNEHFKFWPVFLLGGVIGLIAALQVDMISMPQLVAMLHCFVGAAAVLVGFAKYLQDLEEGALTTLALIETYIGVFIGAVTFIGSIVAWGKLQGVIRSSPLMICGWGRHVLNILLLTGCAAIGVLFGLSTEFGYVYLLANMTIGFVIGWHMVMAIGGADMPVVVSMLNSYSGWATAASGFLLDNVLLIITGALVGASGAILSYIMCKAMNRSFFSVILGGFGQGSSSGAPAAAIPEGEPTPVTIKEFMPLLTSAKSVVIVPGYGMAVSRCQHDVGTLVDVLRKAGKTVRFCIHPVAGRLPGHMNVLLAEADVPYQIVQEMDEINNDFKSTDLVLVLGANDIVNPDALENPASPIAGMPVCEVWHSKKVVVFKRGAGAGYAGIENPLFIKPNTRMYYGSADKTIQEILTQTREKYNNTESTDSGNTLPDEEEIVEEVDDAPIPDPILTLGVPKEVEAGERRVAMVPTTVKKFRRLGFHVVIQEGAGLTSDFADEEYAAQGAEIVKSAMEIWNGCSVVLKVRKLGYNEELQVHEKELLENVSLLVSYFYPAQDAELMDYLSATYPKLSVMAMDCVPRITRAQKLDSLSSMANIAGYRAIAEAFGCFQRCPKAQVTAAGKLPPAKVLIIGCGVAGLSAIGYAKSMGCVVRAFDTRPAAKEQAESLGAEFLTVNVTEDGSGMGGYAKEMSEAYKQAQNDMTIKACRDSDIVITTALIPGRPAPKLVDETAIRSMKRGSVIVDMAAEMGGNCALTRKNELYVDPVSRVQIVGYTDLVSRMSPTTSDLFSNNLWHLLDEMKGAADPLVVDMEDEIFSQMTIVHEGKVTWVPFEQRKAPEAPKPAAPAATTSAAVPLSQLPDSAFEEEKTSCCESYGWIFQIFILCAVFVGVALGTGSHFMTLFMSFILACCIGYMVIWNVAPSLHTPLMSVTNAISGIIVIGAMLLLKSGGIVDVGSGLALLGVFFASINVIGGFVVTQRMLNMFKKGSK